MLVNFHLGCIGFGFCFFDIEFYAFVCVRVGSSLTLANGIDMRFTYYSFKI